MSGTHPWLREGRRQLEGDLVEMGLFLLPCHDRAGTGRQADTGKGRQYDWVRVTDNVCMLRVCCLLPHETTEQS